RALEPLALVLVGERPARRAVQQYLARRGRQVFPGRVEIELEGAGERRQNHLPHVTARLTPRQDHALEDREARVAEDQVGVHLPAGAESGALRTRAERRVERELPRLGLPERASARRAGVALREQRRLRAAGA